ncbi:hypothetical protein PoB_001977400 [Plakobranchus ocellatus]|uniref:Uncharacterized protein n=1 Tax=Plakobranchus ocellatus TaxID=259542 RepID=A0AAV3ZD14_9GAST|nr:hypothetical protein PoB_001977400 [Plakobranchus ocellatus]
MDILRTTNFFYTTVLAFVLGALCGEPHQINMLETIKRTTAEQSNLNSIVNLESLERSPTADGYRFTLRLTKNINPLRIIVQDNIVPPRTPDRLNQTPDGVWEISFVVPYNTAGRFPFPWMIISDRDVFHLVTIMLNNTGSSSASQNITELPVLFIDPAREATYDTDEDIVVSVFVPRNNETGQVIQSLPKMFTGLDLNSMRVYMDLDEEGVFTLGRPEERAGGISANITIHTSSRPISGYLQFSTGVEDTGGSVAMFIQVEYGQLVQPSVINADKIRAAFLLYHDSRGSVRRLTLPGDSIILHFVELIERLPHSSGYWIRASSHKTVFKTATGYGAPPLTSKHGGL